ncbi:MAG: peptide deformylase [Actinomycetota bacterium]
MAIHTICITGEPVLHRPSAPVGPITEELRALVADMFETMEAAPGVGLAAPQIGLDLALFVWRWEDENNVLQEGVAINPVLLVEPTGNEPLDEDEEAEGCLSVPGERFGLRRSHHAILTATNLDGEEFTIDAHGWLARIFQHEYDHLLGILYVDRLSEPRLTQARREIRRAGWGKPGHSWMPGVDHLED